VSPSPIGKLTSLLSLAYQCIKRFGEAPSAYTRERSSFEKLKIRANGLLLGPLSPT